MLPHSFDEEANNVADVIFPNIYIRVYTQLTKHATAGTVDGFSSLQLVFVIDGLLQLG